MVVAAAVAVVVSALKAALSGLANAVLNEAKAALIRVVNAALKVVQNALRLKAVVTAIAATDQNAQNAETVAENARACHVTQRKKNWPWPTRPPWQPLRVVRSPHRKLNVKIVNPAKPVNHAKVAVNAVVVALNAVTRHPRLTLVRLHLPKLALSVQNQ